MGAQILGQKYVNILGGVREKEIEYVYGIPQWEWHDAQR